MTALSTYSFVLTVAEGKRLIAKGVVQLPAVQRALREGTVVVCKGSTNAYIVEELTGQSFDKGSYVLGRTVPTGRDTAAAFQGARDELVLRCGQPVDLPYREALAEAKRGDVVIKGANALNYEAGVAGLLVGHPEGGTVAAIIGHVYGKGLHLIIPVGLEKEVAEDLRELGALINQDPEVSRAGMPSLWLIEGEIITELEALELLTGVEAHQISAGGLCGAEGGSWFAVWGTEDEIAACKTLVESLHGEPPFGA